VVRLPPSMWVTWVQIPCMKGSTSSRAPQARPPYPTHQCKSLWIKASAKCINIYINIQSTEPALPSHPWLFRKIKPSMRPGHPPLATSAMTGGTAFVPGPTVTVAECTALLQNNVRVGVQHDDELVWIITLHHIYLADSFIPSYQQVRSTNVGLVRKFGIEPPTFKLNSDHFISWTTKSTLHTHLLQLGWV